MAFVPPQAGYDRAITVFSPDGRLFQVNYAREAVKKGATAVGVKWKEGVVLAVEKRITSKLIEPSSYEKIFQIDDHIAAAPPSGIIADARVLVDRARLEAQVYRLTYGEPVPLTVLVKKICDLKQAHTQYGGVRPFGAALLMAGVNDKPELYETDPSGAYFEWKAVAIGSGRNTIMAIFEEHYSDDLDMEGGAIKLAIMALAKTIEEPSADSIEVAYITMDDKRWKKLEKESIANYLNEILEEAKEEEVEEKAEDYSELDRNY